MKKIRIDVSNQIQETCNSPQKLKKLFWKVMKNKILIIVNNRKKQSLKIIRSK